MELYYLPERAREYFSRKIEKQSNPELRIFDRNTTFDLDSVKRVHITGICGTATASLAKLLVDQGITVTGSDLACYPPMSTVLSDMNISVQPYDIEHVKDADLVITANMSSPTNVEAAYCRDHHITNLSMSEAIREFAIRDKKSIVVAGTHGKTTTTGIAIHVLEQLGLHPSFLVGGVQQSSGESALYNSESNYFVIEGDEYDTAYFDKSPKFLHYKPFYTIITSIELDHIDIYADFEDYMNSFRFLIEATDPNGTIVMCVDDAGVQKLYDEYKDDKRIITYGTGNNAIMTLKNITTTSDGESAELYKNNEKVATLALPMFGAYNILNALAVYTVVTTIGTTSEETVNAFKNFKGMKRRQEIFGEKNGITVIDDFAHHPTAVNKTLLGIKERFSGHRIVALFEPRSNSSRSKQFEEEYMHSFDAADIIVFSTPQQKEGYNPEEFMDIDLVVKSLQDQGKEVYGVGHADEAINVLGPIVRPDDIIVVMSNGSFDGIHQKLLNNF
jgi:UDP-N-acetylmuramate: L-alanyl-gamma-D-glutamyl-meso-diaminopimelate ligase